MDIKTYIAAAVVALTAACSQAPEEVPVDESAAAQVELNEDGSVAGAETPNTIREDKVSGDPSIAQP